MCTEITFGPVWYLRDFWRLVTHTGEKEAIFFFRGVAEFASLLSWQLKELQLSWKKWKVMHFRNGKRPKNLFVGHKERRRVAIFRFFSAFFPNDGSLLSKKTRYSAMPLKKQDPTFFLSLFVYFERNLFSEALLFHWWKNNTSEAPLRLAENPDG